MRAAPTPLRPVGPVQVEYRLDLRESRLRDQIVVTLYGRSHGVDGDTADLPHPLELDERAIEAWPDPEDRRLLACLLGSSAEERREVRMVRRSRFARSVVRPVLYTELLPALCRTRRFYADLDPDGRGPIGPMVWDADPPFGFELRVQPEEEGDYSLSGWLVRGGEQIEVSQLTLLLGSGIGVEGRRLVLLGGRNHAEWAQKLRRAGAIRVPREGRDRCVLRLARMSDLPDLVLPPELHWSRVTVAPRPVLQLRVEDSDKLEVHLAFEYEGRVVSASERGSFVPEDDGRRLLRRDRAAELQGARRLSALGLADNEGSWMLSRTALPGLVGTLSSEGWRIEADGGRLRLGGVLKGKVRSGIDWFDLEGSVDFAGQTTPFPELLAAASRGDAWVPLPDGSRGMMPDWLSDRATLARLGIANQLTLRFSMAQAGVLDALLTGQPQVETDIAFESLRTAWDKVAAEAVQEPAGFKGKLRPYQEHGVAWLRWLSETGCGGCLADDMGLGKTVQVLCWLQERHPPAGLRPDRVAPPSLIVVPKSLLSNWAAEARKFTALKVLVYAGPDRTKHSLADHDLVVTTYGTLRTDVLRFSDVLFKTLILDEAQAIKNPRSQAAKAVRVVRAEQRLAVSGTPIENGLAELWALFDFLNPGMLGDLDGFRAPGRERDEEWLQMLRRSLKPFMLRRTKEQVLTELPGKTETTLKVSLRSEERRRYDELRNHYRRAIKEQIGARGLGFAQVQVLEALLRLRQAACHPGLLDSSRSEESSAKLDLLLEKVREVAVRGHKSLVFSQFTRLLELVGAALTKEGLSYAYLDGRTRDRGAEVERFQTDPLCKVFLISIKAGGCGLNLTQSDYVFILDPWWNPAVEAQAVDRAHRMGQTNRVFAYRLIGEGTVEEKILELQNEKRRLADQLVQPEATTLKDLAAADVERLLSD
ncbi:MAG: DEAD/DEAH box helicase [Myxococcota bacterium]